MTDRTKEDGSGTTAEAMNVPVDVPVISNVPSVVAKGTSVVAAVPDRGPIGVNKLYGCDVVICTAKTLLRVAKSVKEA